MKKRKLNKRIFLLLTAAVLSSTAAFAGIAITEPKDGATVPLLTDAQKAYLAMPRAERRSKLSDSLERRKSRIMMESSAERVAGSKEERKTCWPKSVRLAWMAKDETGCTVSVKDVKTGACVYESEVKGGSVNIDNLEIATEYEWTVSGGGETATSRFKTEDMAPRFVRFPGVLNVRDLGGRIGLGGKRVKQGLVFRSAGLNENATSTYYTKEELEQLGRLDEAKNGKRVVKGQKPGNSRVEGENGEYIRARFGIKSDIDLRSDGECYGMKGSPLGESVTWFHYPSSAYDEILSRGGKEAFKKVFKVFLDRNNYPIDFHCIGGRDRAGTVAFILNALLGVEKVQLYLDWRATGLWDSSIGYRQERRFDALVRGFRKKYPAPTINESVEKYVLSLGFTSEDIATFRGIMFFGLHPFFERRISPTP